MNKELKKYGIQQKDLVKETGYTKGHVNRIWHGVSKETWRYKVALQRLIEKRKRQINNIK